MLDTGSMIVVKSVLLKLLLRLVMYRLVYEVLK